MDALHPRPIQAQDLQIWLQEDRANPLLVDVREDGELELARFPAAVLPLPLSQSEAWLSTLPQQFTPERPVVVLCHAGVRSLHFGLWLLQQMPALEVWNLEGGIDAWSVHVDSTVPRY